MLGCGRGAVVLDLGDVRELDLEVLVAPFREKHRVMLWNTNAGCNGVVLQLKNVVA